MEIRDLSRQYGPGCPLCLELTGPEADTNVCPECRTVVACNHLDLTLGAGEILGVVGESGSGKSTLVRCLYLAEEVTAGECFLAAYDSGHTNIFAESSQKKRFIRNHLMGIVYQNPLLGIKPHFTAGGNVAEKLSDRGGL